MSNKLSKQFFYAASFSFLTIFILTTCIDDGESESKVKMCAIDNSFATCSYDCKDSGESYIATYGTDWDPCWDDVSTVEANFDASGVWSPGPNASSSSGGSSSDSGTNSGSGGLNCDVEDVWTGSPSDVQVYTICQTACVYFDAGGTDQGNQTCSLLDGYGASARSSCTVC